MIPEGRVAFDPAFYTSRYDDLRHMSDAEAYEHFRQYGLAEGRQAHKHGTRTSFTAYVNTFGRILEIGPFCNPVARGDNVCYLDVLNEAQLRIRALELGLDPNGCPERIHYIGNLEDVNEQFDAIVSSHSVEHQPDLIGHLKEVSRLLKSGGKYLLYIPDKRFCFDHFIEISSIAEVLQAHSDGRRDHILRSVIEHNALNTHNDAHRHWAGDHDVEHGKPLADRISDAIKLHEGREAYIDVHAWYFTPDSFLEITTILRQCNFTQLEPLQIFTTLRDELEFFAILQKTN